MKGDLAVGIVVFEGADEMDVVGPYRVLGAVNDVRAFVEAPRVTLHLVGQQKASLRLAFGLKVEPSHDFQDCPRLDVLVVPGGSSNNEQAGRRVQQKNESLRAFVLKQTAGADVTASVCTGTFILAEAGLLSGRQANTNAFYRQELRDLMEARGESFVLVPERVVWDERLATAGGVTSGIDLGLSVVERLCGAEVRRAVEMTLELETPA
ncbi:MAG: DJ-1/PfpI family protein [Actinobacteria bacterium]|nr:DJ-1/PfpI family protein [Actinomycetota bacterium]